MPKRAIDRRPLAEFFKQVLPCDLAHAIQKFHPEQRDGSEVCISSIRDGKNEMFMKRPFITQHEASRRADLRGRYQLKLQSTHNGSLFFNTS